MNMNEDDLSRMLQQSRLVVSADEIDRTTTRLANEIDARYQQQVPIVICIMNGGLMLTAQLMSKVKIHARIDYLQTSRYRGKTRGGELHWRAEPQYSFEGCPVILVDDIFDEGDTLLNIVAYCKDHGASDVFTVVLLDKKHDRKVKGFRPDLIGLEVEDDYLVGFGMDYQEHFRHLPAIYALSEHLADEE
jgi:hypoxanthine phosphoribosyltransferase